ncbi:cytochrome C biogenesis protein [Gammaproteobacteria bacterium MFB021]|nr:cytochrome C biogenesis protein [Gammaproteobacteria bacterium MFB021]
MEFKDYYAVLGVERDATQEEIKRAYRKLARKYHPDVSHEADAEARFKALGEAYEVLKDPEKRAAYDRLGGREGERFEAPPDWDAGFEFSGGGYTHGESADFSDFFETLFGRRGARGGFSGFDAAGGFEGAGRTRNQALHGEDHHAKVLIELEDAYQGATRTLSLQRAEFDPQGHLRPRERTLKVRIPKGVKAGQRIRLAGQGGPGANGAAAGDLYLEVEFRPHSRYRVEGRDVAMTLPVAPWEAALGTTLALTTPGGEVTLKVPAGSGSGRRLRLKGRGIPGTPPGDLYVELTLVTPPADSEAVAAAYRQLAEASAFDPRAELGGNGS